MDKSGFLETAEIGRVVAKYKGEDWESWDAKQRDDYLIQYMKWFDSEGAKDSRLDKQEFIRYVVTEAIVRNPEDPDASVGAVLLSADRRLAASSEQWCAQARLCASSLI